jgi:hypothetical protein
MSLHHGLAIVEEADPASVVEIEFGRVDRKCGVEACAEQPYLFLGAAARVYHCHRVYRHAVRPLSGVGLGHPDVIQPAHWLSPCCMQSSRVRAIRKNNNILVRKYDEFGAK